MNNENTQEIETENPTPQVLGVQGISSREGFMDTAIPSTKKIDPVVMKRYQTLQKKYMEVYGRYVTRKNWIKKIKLGQRLKQIEAQLLEVEKNLYID